MNFLLAWLLITIGFTVGMHPFLVNQDDVLRAKAAGLIETRDLLVIHDVLPGAPLSATAAKPGDVIATVNGQPAPVAEHFSDLVMAGKPVTLGLLHGDQPETVTVMPDGKGRLGVALSDEEEIVQVKPEQVPWYKAPGRALWEIGRLSLLTVSMFGHVIVTLV